MEEENIQLPVSEDIGLAEYASPSNEDIEYYKLNVAPRLYQLSNLISQFKTEKDIFAFLGISRDKFNLYKRWFPDFKNAVVQGKYALTERMERSLEQAASGGRYEETETTNIYEPDPTTGVLKLVQKKEKIVKKESPPNVRALEMILTNRAPDRWKKTQPDNVHNTANVTQINVTEGQVKGFIKEFNSALFSDTKPSPKVVEAEVVDDD